MMWRELKEFKWRFPRAWRFSRVLSNAALKVGIILAVAGVVYLTITGFQSDDGRLLQVAELFLIGGSVGLVYVQMRKQHKWNRRKVSQDLLFELAVGHLRSLRGKLEEEFDVNYSNPRETYQSVYDRLEEEERREAFERRVKHLFNYFEVIAVGVENGIIDDEICFDTLDLVLTEYFRWGKNHINDQRGEGQRRLWAYFQDLAEKWRPRRQMIEDGISERVEKARKDGERPRHRPL